MTGIQPLQLASRAHRSAGRGPRRFPFWGALSAGLVGIGCLVASVSAIRARAVEAEGPAPLRIAIAPFEGEQGKESISQLLSTRVARLGVERLLAPGSFAAGPEFDPRADAVRVWARDASVDSIIFGRVVRPAARSKARQIEAVVRSGHSGAELFRHAVRVPGRAALGSALDQLATAIVRDLGGDPLASSEIGSDPILPPVSTNAAGAVSDSTRAGSQAGVDGSRTADPEKAGTVVEAPAPKKAAGAATTEGKSGVKASSGLETRIGVAKFQADAPIEIKADQAEITVEGEGRRLIFQGNVWVKQDNVVLTSDRLEAEYVEGASEPSRLLGQGSVHVEQGNRKARCDRAEYLRSTGTLTCRGHAELVQGCDVVRGEVIVLELAADKARVEGAASIVINPGKNADSRCSIDSAVKPAVKP